MTSTDRPGCCAPARGVSAPAPERAGLAGGSHGIEQVEVPAGTFAMGDHHGDGHPGDGETPVHEVTQAAFRIDATSVTAADFGAFVDATGYRTEAETFGFSAVFHSSVAADAADVMGRAPGTPWWLGVNGADWRHPDGPRSDLEGRLDHPVTHVSWHDAQAYCAYAGRRLPTEAEWERASRGGLDGARYPWGDELLDSDGRWRCNIWQGSFPRHNTAEDGWLTTAPVRTYEPNAYGLWQTVGNVWEWCADVFDPTAYRRGSPLAATAGANRVMRGGSFLCHDSYCNRYRNAARSSNTPDSSMANAGFRTVAR